MRLSRMATALAVAVSSGCAPATVATVPSAPAVVSVVTWNTNAGRGDLDRLAFDLETGRLAGRTSGAYVLLLQEITEAEIEAVAASRKWATRFAPVSERGGRVRGNGIVSSLPLQQARVLPLPRIRQPRAAVVGRIDVAGERLFVASVHLENRVSWWKGGLFSDSARRHQVEGLLRALPADGPGILGGDLNMWLGPGEPGWQALTRRFTDTPAWPRPPTFRDRLVLDHVLLDLPDGWHATRRVASDDYGSDHHPVLAVVYGPEA
jgi:endonuclease/exonuclease/phosphatase family metal-dependent hydrolase